MKTRAQAWRYIAKKILTEGRITVGLCKEVGTLYVWDEISLSVRTTMRRQLAAHVDAHRNLEGYTSGYVYRPGTHHVERAMAALWMAEEAAEEDGK